MANLVMDHSMPLFCLTIDYVLLSTVPFCNRHCIALVPLILCYLSINFYYQCMTGGPVYPIMNWVKPMGIVLVCGSIVLLFILFFAMKYITKYKLCKLGHF